MKVKDVKRGKKNINKKKTPLTERIFSNGLTILSAKKLMDRGS
jgi:hypothetical protein